MAKIIVTASAQTLLKVWSRLAELQPTSPDLTFKLGEELPIVEAEVVKPSEVAAAFIYVPPDRHRVVYKSTGLPVRVALGHDLTVYRFIQKNPGSSARNIANSTGLKPKVVENSLWRLRHTQAVVSEGIL